MDKPRLICPKCGTADRLGFFQTQMVLYSLVDVDDDWPLPEALASLVHTCAMGVLTGREQEDMDAFHKESQAILDRVKMLKEKK